MSSLAEDLLKSRTIPELKNLVITLKNEYNNKKSELQAMVGSKYHDFIQSADKISCMKDVSVVFDDKINSFSKLINEIIHTVHGLLEHSTTVISSSQSTSQMIEHSKKKLFDHISIKGQYDNFMQVIYEHHCWRRYEL